MSGLFLCAKVVIETSNGIWNNLALNTAIELRDKGYTSSQVAKYLDDKLDFKITERSVRKKLQKLGKPFKHRPKQKINDNEATEALEDSEEVKHVQNKDGSATSTIETVIDSEPSMTPEFLLKVHHYDPTKWKIKQSVSNHWSVINSKGKKKFNFQSKIIVEPIVKELNVDELIDHIVSHKEPYKQQAPILLQSNRYLVVPSFDTHFNGKTLETYVHSLNKQLSIINQARWQDVLLILGGDNLHVDNVKSTTLNGTQLETTDLAKAVDEAETYYETLISAILKHSNHLHIMYSPGNHDPTTSYMFCRLLERAYSNQPNMSFDVSLDHYKGYLLGNNFVGATHGDKGHKRYLSIFMEHFAQLLLKAKADHAEADIFTGHLHFQLDEDLGGMIQRQQPTRKPNDTWTADNGLISVKKFELVEYSKNETEAVYYV